MDDVKLLAYLNQLHIFAQHAVDMIPSMAGMQQYLNTAKRNLDGLNDDLAKAQAQAAHEAEAEAHPAETAPQPDHS